MKNENQTVTLDLRPLPPYQRHSLIFETWGGLAAGQTLKIINDHDPKPLKYQFQFEHADTFEWEYVQSGPVDWVVNINKIR